ncbi:hypothetical protein R3I93_012088 [Phoxinus phoxinus]|uniref:Uncharacterized protein n=1 Tax=Phoxinus phoxinus TaxID=58324 RepID=A0AAN9H418_9TELE
MPLFAIPISREPNMLETRFKESTLVIKRVLERSTLSRQGGHACGDSNEELYIGYLNNHLAESPMIQPQLTISHYHPVQALNHGRCQAAL